VLVGAPATQLNVPHFPMIFKRLTFGGSLIGGIKETQEMLDFSAEHGITCDIEVRPHGAYQLVPLANAASPFQRGAELPPPPPWCRATKAPLLAAGPPLASHEPAHRPPAPPPPPPPAGPQVIDADYINKAYERVMAGDVKFRFVIDVQKSLLMDA
jgi:hypothetical protein